MHSARDEHPVATRRADRHQGRLRGRCRAVVVRCRDDVESGQLGDERLVFVDRLERALADLGLVGRVGRVELAAAQDLVDRCRYVMAVGTGAQEADQIGPIAPGKLLKPARKRELVKPVRNVQAVSADGDRDVGEKRVDRVNAESAEHPLAVSRGVRAVAHALGVSPPRPACGRCRGPSDGRSRRLPRQDPTASAEPSSLRRMDRR